MLAESSITLAVDAMGGYLAPDVVVRAVAKASLRVERERPVFFTLVGDEMKLTNLLLELNHNSERIHICHAPNFVAMSESSQNIVAHKPDSSIAIACRLVAAGEADAVVTAGNPAAAVQVARNTFRLLPNVKNAALASVYPTPRMRGEKEDPFSLILDVGATLRADAEDLLTFGLMGTAYARIVSKNPHPRVALLSNSRESTVGLEYILEAYKKLSEHRGVNFYGTIEGHEIPRGLADVVVCEGFVGNVSIKILEGVTESAFDLARAAYNRRFAWRMGLRMLSGGLHQLKQLTDFEEYGGAPLLGMDKVMILTHPGSSERAVGNALRLAIRNVRANLPNAIAEMVGDANNHGREFRDGN